MLPCFALVVKFPRCIELTRSSETIHERGTQIGLCPGKESGSAREVDAFRLTASHLGQARVYHLAHLAIAGDVLT